MHNPFQTGTDGQTGIGDPLAFIKKLWGDMQLPGMVTPTISVDELDKQIKDLKTVESWLNVNMNMLRGTIQALEVQRATITALKAMGESFAQATAGKADQSAQAKENAHAAWPMHQETGKVSEAQADTENEEDEDVDEASEISEPVRPAAEKLDPPAASTSASSETESPHTTSSKGFSHPGAWWNLLQEQFKQALGNAMIEEETPKASTAEQKSKSSATAKGPRKTAAPRTKSTGKSVEKKAAVVPVKVTKPKTPASASKANTKATVKKSTASQASRSKTKAK